MSVWNVKPTHWHCSSKHIRFQSIAGDKFGADFLKSVLYMCYICVKALEI